MATMSTSKAANGNLNNRPLPQIRSRAGAGSTNIVPTPSISTVVARNMANNTAQKQQSDSRPNSQQQRYPPRPQQRQLTISDSDSDLDGFDSSEDELATFYTPNQSPRTSMASSSIVFPSKGKSAATAAGPQPRKPSRKSLHTSTPVQITPTNSNSSAMPSVGNGHVGSNQHYQKQPQPIGTSSSASVLLQQQQQRVANVNRKVSNPVPAAHHRRPLIPESQQRRPSIPETQQRRVSNPLQAASRKPSVPSTTTALPQPDTAPATATPPSFSAQTHARNPSIPKSASTSTPKSSPTATPNSTASLSRASSLNQRPSPSSTLRGAPSSSAATAPHPPRLAKPTRITSTTSSVNSVSSTSLENHSDLHSGSDELLTDSTTMTSPVTPDQGKAAKPTAPKHASLRSTRLPATYHSFSGNIIQQQQRKSGSGSHHTQQSQILQRDYSYTEDDWAKDVRYLAGSIVTGSSETVNRTQANGHVPPANENGNADLKRSGSSASKRDGKDADRGSLGLGLPLDGKRKSVDKGKGKGKEKEVEGDEDNGSDKKDKKRRKSKTTERDVVYYTATNGMPRVPPSTPPEQELTPAAKIRNGYTQNLINMTALMEQDEDDRSTNDGRDVHLRDRLSVVSEREEEAEEAPPTPKLAVANANAREGTPSPATTPRSLASANKLQSRSMAESDMDSVVVVDASEVREGIQREREERRALNPAAQISQTSVSTWAEDYKTIVARTKAQQQKQTGIHVDKQRIQSPPNSALFANASVASGSQNSFAYQNALPVATGELPSQGMPGYTALHTARAPPGMYVKDGELMSKPNVSSSGGWLKGILSHSTSPAGYPYRQPEDFTPHMTPNALDGRVDLTRSGVAQTTMASVEVVRGLGGLAGSKSSGLGKKGLKDMLGNLSRRRTVSGGEAQDILNKQKKGGLSRAFTLSFGGGSRLRKASENVYTGRKTGTLSTASTKAGAIDARAQAMMAISSERILGFTSYRRPPTYVPSGSVLVQVWAVGVDGVDGKLLGLRLGPPKANTDIGQILDGPLVDEPEEEGRLPMYNGETEGEETEREDGRAKKGNGLGRTTSFRARLGSLRLKGGRKKDKDSTRDRTKGKEKEKTLPPPPLMQPEVGFIPGRSFVGRVLECGWEVKEEVVRKGEWVIGLLDTKKSGGLTQFIVVDRHRVRRIPHPASVQREETTAPTSTTTSFNSFTTNSTARLGLGPPPPQPAPPITLEELALLPLCGLPAYRAVRTFMGAFSGLSQPTTSPRPFDYPSFASAMNSGTFLGGPHHPHADHEPNRRRRVLVLRGHDGIGAMAVRMLVLRGWRVSVHIPVPGPHDHDDIQRYMIEMEERVSQLGGEEVVFDDGGNGGDSWWDEGRGAAVRIIDGLRLDGDVFDAVLDTIGGKEVREASERLLRSRGRGDDEFVDTPVVDGPKPEGRRMRKTGPGQFTTLVGDVPERIIPTVADNFRAGLRSLKLSGGAGGGGANSTEADGPAGSGVIEEVRGKVGYAWVSTTQDVDWEGEDISETLGNVLRLALEYEIRPVIPRISVPSGSAVTYKYKNGVVPFEMTPEVFVDGDGPLCNGGTMVVKIAL